MRCEIQVCVDQPEPDSEYVGQCLHALLRTRAWRLLRTARDTPFRSFLRFCRAPRPHGLGLTRGDVERFIGLPDHPHPFDGPEAAEDVPAEAEGASSPALDGAKDLCRQLSETDRAALLRWLLDLEG
jgi:hypothetical protein